MKEIERKFLVADISNINLKKYEKKTITQVYLYSDRYTAIRKRKIEENNGEKFFYTVKTNKAGKYGVEEIENEISKEEYNKLKESNDINTIKKDRYIIPIENNLKIELDVFKEIFDGIIFAEVEFPSENMAEEFQKPDWFGKELSGKISNSKMAKHSKKEVDEIIKNI